MRPVNITFDDDIGAEDLDTSIEQRERRKRTVVQRHSVLAKRGWRDKQLDVVCTLCVPDVRMERCAPFDQDALDVMRRELAPSRRDTLPRARNDRGRAPAA